MQEISHLDTIQVRKILTCNGNTTESKPRFDIQTILYGMSRREYDRVSDEPIFVPFYCSDHGSLGSRRLVMMYDTNTSQELYQIV